MHETMVAQSLLKQILDEAAKQNAKPVAAKISCGKLNDINDEVLRFAFDVITKGTICEQMKLEVEHKHLEAKCKICNEYFQIDFSNPKCSNCQSNEFELMPDAPLILEEIEFNAE
jgi:hydrogenase nickel incorporation protein HypA/HybF